jgi:dTDP-4-amino-4,6-dideoxygalactose transaminase
VLVAAQREQIEIRSYHAPLHQLPAFAPYPARTALPVTEELAALTLSLPLANAMPERELDRISGLLCSHARAPDRMQVRL